MIFCGETDSGRHLAGENADRLALPPAHQLPPNMGSRRLLLKHVARADDRFAFGVFRPVAIKRYSIHRLVQNVILAGLFTMTKRGRDQPD
jgi:hypothetical protein